MRNGAIQGSLIPRIWFSMLSRAALVGSGFAISFAMMSSAASNATMTYPSSVAARAAASHVKGSVSSSLAMFATASFAFFASSLTASEIF